MVQGVKAQMDSDSMWTQKVCEVVNEHGDTLDNQHQSIKSQTEVLQVVAARFSEMKGNEKIIETKILEGDAQIKEILAQNDTMIKAEVNSNDVDVRRVVALNDAAVKASLILVDEKVQQAMVENKFIKEKLDTTAI